MNRLASYGIGILCGAVLLFSLMPVGAITGDGGLWRSPAADTAQTLTGHLALQLDRWRLPPLRAGNLFWPRGASIALTDSNSLFSLGAKLVTTVRGGAPVNGLGLWLACCWLLQPVAAVYAVRALTRSRAGAFAAAVLAGLFPALLMRVGHVNLCGHFFLLLALGLALRLLRAERPGRWAATGAVLTAAVLCHPYLFMASAATVAAVPAQAVLRRQRGRWRTCARFAAAAALPMGAFLALAGTLGGGDKGFVYYSMNLLSPFWPQRSGLFGADLPVIDATGGQYEGFCYLGAGGILLLLAAVPTAGRLRRWPGLVAVMAGLTVLALSSRVYAGHTRLLDLGAKPWEDIFGVFRAAGRAFWPVGYALVLGSVAAACRLPPRARWALLASAVVLQVIDSAPLRRDAAAALAGEIAQAAAVPTIPAAGGTLLTALPAPGCGASAEARALTNPLLLAGVRAGMRLGDVGMGRAPVWFSCEAVLSDALELPLQPRELRAFIDDRAQAPLRPARLGPEAECRTVQSVVWCARGLALDGEPIAAAPASSHGGLADVLGYGWRADADGSAWSDGPRASLLLPAPDGDLVLTLRIGGVGQQAGTVRRVTLTAGNVALPPLDLPDGEPRVVTVPIPASAVAHGVLRLAFDMRRPVDPAARGLAAPVRRAALHLAAASLSAAPATGGRT